MIGNGTLYVFQYRVVWIMSGVILGIAVITCAILLVLWIVETGQRGKRVQHEGSALDILDKRYARGEITKEQYVDMKKDISAK
ncbi:MAG TPA: SHOCT domain-containing protein [Geobacteraceae bacterium]|nr:SHOCT domain-containing protein [Geobacteraceae bacterium]